MKINHLFLKSQSLLWTVLLCLSACVAGCQKSPINGDLDGQWQVMSVDPEPSDKVISDRIYYCFYLHTCQLSIYDIGIWTAGNMTYDGENLTLDFPNANSSESVSKLKHYGIYTNPVTFNIEYLDNKKLVLRNGETVVTLRKF
ncbi:MAG: lipocalin-like domain-containing protein [Muribaculaceae bacterium]|nr:lipocalin-like domain-containing protein [Muribaculaceae bacterium]